MLQLVNVLLETLLIRLKGLDSVLEGLHAVLAQVDGRHGGLFELVQLLLKSCQAFGELGFLFGEMGDLLVLHV